MNLLTKQKETHRLRKTYDCQGKETVKDLGKIMYTLLCLKWITSKDLLYSTWNSAQCCLPVWMGGRFQGEWMHIYVYMYMYIYIYMSQSLHCSPKPITTLLINYTPIQNKNFEKKISRLFPSLQCSFPSCCLTSYTFQLFFYWPRQTISSRRAGIFVCFANSVLLTALFQGLDQVLSSRVE